MKGSFNSKPGLFLCLSGGGFRAALFHYGVLKRLRELNRLDDVRAVSAVSGGAFVAALFNMYRDDWNKFEDKLLRNIQRGVLAPVAMLVVSYATYLLGFGMAWFLPGTTRMAGWALCMIAGLVLHICALSAVRSEEEAPPLPLARWIHLALSPSELRIETISTRLFARKPLEMMTANWPSTYLVAVDLNSGQEIAMTTGLAADLGPLGCRFLWEAHTEEKQHEMRDVPIGRAVAASSAFPPVFKPVGIGGRVFLDGGTVDNFGVNLVKALSVHITAARGRYATGGLQSFSDRFGSGTLLVCDGSQYLTPRRQHSYTRLGGLMRLVEVVAHQQASDLSLTSWMLSSSLSTDAQILSLGQVGLPAEDPLAESQFPRLVASVRTHLDSFSAEECEAIAYCGYRLADLYGGGSGTAVPLAELGNVLPEPYRPEDTSRLMSHLRHSQWRTLPIRWVLRKLCR